MRFIGFVTEGESAGGRLDEAEHPFTTGYYSDVRITTHYYPNRFSSSIYSVMHEGGHALYEQGIPQEWMYQPIGSPCSYGIHESQSRYVENMIGRSPEFLSYMLPRLKKMTGKALTGIKTSDFVSAVNIIEPSKIRIEADEATYGLHIIVRFEMEKDIMSGKLSVDELPGCMERTVRQVSGNEDRERFRGSDAGRALVGRLVRIFPQLCAGEHLRRHVPGEDGQGPAIVEEGHQGRQLLAGQAVVGAEHPLQGQPLRPGDLVKNVTGKDLDISPFIRYLERKCKYVYGV